MIDGEEIMAALIDLYERTRFMVDEFNQFGPDTQSLKLKAALDKAKEILLRGEHLSEDGTFTREEDP